MVGDNAVGKGGAETPTRMTPTPFENGSVNSTARDSKGGATGGGKVAGFGQRGLLGPMAPPSQRRFRVLASAAGPAPSAGRVPRAPAPKTAPAHRRSGVRHPFHAATRKRRQPSGRPRHRAGLSPGTRRIAGRTHRLRRRAPQPRRVRSAHARSPARTSTTPRPTKRPPATRKMTGAYFRSLSESAFIRAKLVPMIRLIVFSRFPCVGLSRLRPKSPSQRRFRAAPIPLIPASLPIGTCPMASACSWTDAPAVPGAPGARQGHPHEHRHLRERHGRQLYPAPASRNGFSPHPADNAIGETYGLSLYSDPLPVIAGKTYRITFDYFSPTGTAGKVLDARLRSGQRGKKKRVYEGNVDCGGLARLEKLHRHLPPNPLPPQRRRISRHALRHRGPMASPGSTTSKSRPLTSPAPP